MGSAYNSAQTIQGENSDFNVVNTYFLNVYDQATFDGDVAFNGDVAFTGDVNFDGTVIFNGVVDFLEIVNFRNDVAFFEPTYFASSINVGGTSANPGIIKAPEVELLIYKTVVEDGVVTTEWVSKDPPQLLSELFDTVAELEAADEDGIKTTEVELGTFDTDGNFVRSEPRRRLSRLFDDVGDIEDDINSLDGRVTSLESAIQSIKSIHNMPINLS